MPPIHRTPFACVERSLSLSLMTPLLLLLPTAAAFLAPTVKLPDSGQTLSLHGSGPPVVFSSGLFGLMPRRLYTKLFALLGDHVTLAVLDDAAPVTATVVEGAADALGAEQVGFLAHSSFDAAILASKRVRRSVLCDPVVLPELDLRSGLTSPRVTARGDVLQLRAGHAYDGAGGQAPIPEFLSPTLASTAVATRVTLPEMGHADLLDDPWAELGPRVLPWMRGASAPAVPFGEWTFQRGRGRDEVREARAAYRARVAELARAHLLDDVADENADKDATSPTRDDVALVVVDA
jgi:hypothetical protein